MNRRNAAIIAAVLACVVGCIKLDGMFFETVKATSVAEDYHGLPITLAEDPPEWLADAEVEREIYIETPSGRILDESEKQDADYLHGAFLHAPVQCPAEECPLIGTGVTFLYQHGNSGHMFRYWYRAVALWSMGANVFIYTYRGYGLSSGEASRENVLQDAAAAMSYVKGRADVDPDRIIAYGYSMGGIPTSYLLGRSAHKGAFRAAILESALDSPDETLNLSTNTDFPEGFFMDAAIFDGPTFIGGAPELPILHMHGGDDQRVVMEQAEQYYNVLRDRPGYTHYLGKTDTSGEAWIREGGHRNLPVVSFKGEFHIPDYYDADNNRAHCCIHPIEYTDPAHADFLQQTGKTDGETMQADAQRYHDLVSAWILSIL